jgi:hypothetical protein
MEAAGALYDLSPRDAAVGSKHQSPIQTSYRSLRTLWQTAVRAQGYGMNNENPERHNVFYHA